MKKITVKNNEHVLEEFRLYLEKKVNEVCNKIGYFPKEVYIYDAYSISMENGVATSRNEYGYCEYKKEIVYISKQTIEQTMANITLDKEWNAEFAKQYGVTVHLSDLERKKFLEIVIIHELAHSKTKKDHDAEDFKKINNEWLSIIL